MTLPPLFFSLSPAHTRQRCSDGPFALNRHSPPPSLPPLPPPLGWIFSAHGGRVSFSSREAPLALSGPSRRVPSRVPPRRVRVCVRTYARARARGYSFAAPLPRPSVRPYFRSYVHMFVCWVLESRGRPTAVKPKKTGRGRDPPRPRSFRREISPALSPSTPSFSHGGLKR